MRVLVFARLGWGDAEAAELRLALQYAAAKCAFPEGGVEVRVTYGNSISEEALATLPPREDGDFTGERTDHRVGGQVPHLLSPLATCCSPHTRRALW